MKKITLKDEIYGGNLTIIVGTWDNFIDQHNKRYKGNGNPLPYGPDDPEVAHLGGYHCNLFGLEKGREPFADNMIWVNSELDKNDQITCLAHELLHAGLLLMEMIGVNCTQGSGNHETLTYWHSWALRKCLNELNYLV